MKSFFILLVLVFCHHFDGMASPLDSSNSDDGSSDDEHDDGEKRDMSSLWLMLRGRWTEVML